MNGRRTYGRGGGFGPGIGLGPAVKGLLIANGAVFVLQMLTASFNSARVFDPITVWFSFVPALAINEFQIWRFVTYMFLHGGFMHLAFNMFGLWMFGSRLEEIWGKRSFLIYYFVCGIGGSITYGLFSLGGISSIIPMIGASGAIYGILLAYGMTFPNAIILVMMVIPMKAKYMVMLFGLFEFLSTMSTRGNVAHWAHLGGMAAGFIFLYTTTGMGRRRSARRGSPGGAVGGPGSGRGGPDLGNLRDSWRRWRTKSRLHVVRPDEDRNDRGGRSQNSRRQGGNGADGHEESIDKILDKISREGLESLSEAEKEILRRASRKR